MNTVRVFPDPHIFSRDYPRSPGIRQLLQRQARREPALRGRGGCTLWPVDHHVLSAHTRVQHVRPRPNGPRVADNHKQGWVSVWGGTARPLPHSRVPGCSLFSPLFCVCARASLSLSLFLSLSFSLSLSLFLSFSLSLSLFLSLSVYGIAIVLPRLFYCSYPPATWMCLVFASFNLQQSTSQSQLTVGGRRSSYEWSVPARRQPQAQVAPHLVTTPPPLKQTKRQYISPQQGGRYGVSPSASRPESHMGAHTQSKYLVPEVLSTVASRAASPTSTSRAVSRMGTVGRSPSQTQSAYRHPSVGSSAVTRGPYKSHPQDPLMAKKSFVSDLSNIGRKPGRSPFRR